MAMANVVFVDFRSAEKNDDIDQRELLRALLKQLQERVGTTRALVRQMRACESGEAVALLAEALVADAVPGRKPGNAYPFRERRTAPGMSRSEDS